jgi:hypothetical protein
VSPIWSLSYHYNGAVLSSQKDLAIHDSDRRTLAHSTFATDKDSVATLATEPPYTLSEIRH